LLQTHNQERKFKIRDGKNKTTIPSKQQIPPYEQNATLPTTPTKLSMEKKQMLLLTAVNTCRKFVGSL